MTSDPYIRWAEESSREWRREIFIENLAAILTREKSWPFAAIVTGVFLGIAFSVALSLASFPYGAAQPLQCFPLVDGQREDLLRQ
jgi:hypothetical protein